MLSRAFIDLDLIASQKVNFKGTLKLYKCDFLKDLKASKNVDFYRMWVPLGTALALEPLGTGYKWPLKALNSFILENL